MKHSPAMRSHRARVLRVGALVSVCSAVFVGLILFILGSGLQDDRVEYYIRFEENVKGMVVGSKVNYQGVPTGVVSDIRFQHGATEVTLSLDPSKATIYDVTRARLDRLLVTGQVTIELEGWSQDATPMPMGATIHPVENPMQTLTRTLPEVLDQAGEVLAGADRGLRRIESLLSEANVERVGNILAHLERASESVPVAALDTLGEMHNLLSDARAAVDSLERATSAYGALAEAGGEGRRVLTEARRVLTALGGIEHRVLSAADELQSLVSAARGPLLETLGWARTSFREVQGVAELLRRAPNSLLFGRDEAAGWPTGWPAAPVPGGGN